MRQKKQHGSVTKLGIGLVNLCGGLATLMFVTIGGIIQAIIGTFGLIVGGILLAFIVGVILMLF